MRKEYISPTIEILEAENEDLMVLSKGTVSDYTGYGTTGQPGVVSDKGDGGTTTPGGFVDNAKDGYFDFDYSFDADF